MGDNLTGFPEHFPRGCPPSDAREAGGQTVFRFWDQMPPGEKDRQTHYDRNPELHRTKCKQRGWSVFDTIPNAMAAKARVPALRDKPFLMAATVPPGAGVIKRTLKTEGHHTLWLREPHHSEFNAWCKRVT